MLNRTVHRAFRSTTGVHIHAKAQLKLRASSTSAMARTGLQDTVHQQSLDDPRAFWKKHAEALYWHKKPSIILDEGHKSLTNGIKHPYWSWFPDGELSTDYNCLDRHVKAGNGDNIAIIWDSAVTKTKQKFTYREVLAEVEALAAVLRDEGVKKGDVVLIYMPMIPQAIFAILATIRLGAIHAVVFGGFAPTALGQRIEASKAGVILTASCGIEGNKAPIDYQPFVRGAIESSKWKPEKTIIWQRSQSPWKDLSPDAGERDWKSLVSKAKENGNKAVSVPVKSTDGLYVIYTSGTTGLPKGVLRYAGGHAVGLQLSMAYLFGIRGPGDVMFCASDIGWVVGHAYIIYAPLLAGATTILFEGKPIGTPDAGTFWRICAEHKVNTLFTAPTALRAIRREDPENKLFAKYAADGGLENLQALFLAGERSEPSIVTMYQELLNKYAKDKAQVIDHWWSSESGSPMTGLALMPERGDTSGASCGQILDMKAGSAGKPMPGWDIRIVDDEGNEVKKGSMGNIVLKTPLAPAGFTTLFNDEERFYKGYLKRFNGKWLDTGDAGMIDQDGYVHVMSRSDDIINVAAHRFSTGSIEQVITAQPEIAESCVVGIPDALKGQLPFAFITLSTADHPDSPIPSDQLFKSVQDSVRKQIGGIAVLGGMIQGKGMIPKTRSGKTLRRVLRELIENAVHGDFDKEVQFPATIEDAAVIEVARKKIREYFEQKGKDLHKAIEERPNKAKL